MSRKPGDTSTSQMLEDRDGTDGALPALQRAPIAAVQAIRRYHGSHGLSAELLAAKFEQMAQSPFEFFRINPQLFHEDLDDAYRSLGALLPRPLPELIINGDPHLGNFGTIRGPGGAPVWGINDFDQVRVAPPSRDLQRLSTSVVLVARARSLSTQQQRTLVEEIAQRYFETIDRRARGAHPHPPVLTAAEARGEVKALIEKLDAKKLQKRRQKWIAAEGPEAPRLKRGKKLSDLSEETANAVRRALDAYAQALRSSAPVRRPLQVLDVAEKLGSGGNSYGLPRYFALVAAKSSKRPPVVLELKVLMPVIGGPPALPESGADAVVAAQRLQGARFNPLTGAAELDGRPALVREREPEKDDLDLDELDFDSLREVAAQAGEVLGHAHAQKKFAANAIAKWLGGDEGEAIHRLVSFADAYATQVELDHAELVKALQADAGR